MKLHLNDTDLYRFMLPDSLAPHMTNASNDGTARLLDSRTAWHACGLTFVALFLIFGLTYSYGVFFVALADEFDTSHGATAGLFSATLLVIFCTGAMTGRMTDRVGPRPLIMTGGVLTAGGLFGLSRVQTIWQAYLLYSIGIGLGAGCIYVPVVSALGQWFDRYRSIALGIGVSGIGLGTLVVSPLSSALIGSTNWRTVYLIYAMVTLASFSLIGLAFPRPPGTPRQNSASHHDPHDAIFRRLYLATVLINIALYVPFVLLPASAQNEGISRFASANLVGVIGMTSVVGRLLIGALGKKFETMRLYRGCCALIALSYLIWIEGSSLPTLLAFAMVIGLGYGGYIALTPALLAEFFSTAVLGRRLGVLYTAVGIGAFIGPLMTGWVVDKSGSFTVPLAALCGISGAGWLVMCRVTRPVLDEPHR